MECIQQICSKLLQHYKELEKKLSKWKEELGCEPLCEDRYQSIRQLATTINVFRELLAAFGCE